MSQIQQGRAKAKRTFHNAKTFKKAEKMYREVFNDDNKVGHEDAKFKKKYSRVTHKQVSTV